MWSLLFYRPRCGAASIIGESYHNLQRVIEHGLIIVSTKIWSVVNFRRSGLESRAGSGKI